MKKLILLLLLFGGLYYNYSNKKKFHLKTETVLRKIDQQAFLDQFNQGPSSWMKKQIEDDFRPFFTTGISKDQIEQTALQVQTPMIIRYRIAKGRLYRYFPQGELISTLDNSTEKALKSLLQLIRFKDTDFLISYFDGTPFPGSEVRCEASILVPAKRKGLEGYPLIPDWRSLGEWWISDIKSVQKSMAAIPWEAKKNFAVWRGSVTNRIRVDLCHLAKLHPQYLDAKINLKIEDPFLQEQAQKEELYGDHLSWDEFLSHKYLPIVDGVMCAAPAFQWRLLSNSLTFLQEAEGVQWFYGAIEPFVHFIPVKSDLSDLIEKLQWAQSHDLECRQIAEQSTLFARQSLLFDQVLLYLAFVLKEYSSLQTFDRIAMGKNPRWIDITERKALPSGPGYTPAATPY
jgi:hypothetical protein